MVKTRTINGELWLRLEEPKKDIVGDVFIFVFILSWVFGFLIAIIDLVVGGLI